MYLLCEYEDGTVICRLIASKSKVAPLKPATVPRLEMMGAFLGLQLTQNICRVLQIPAQLISFFSDSKDVLWWTRGLGRERGNTNGHWLTSQNVPKSKRPRVKTLSP